MEYNSGLAFQEAISSSRTYNLEIDEQDLNAELKEPTRSVNSITRKINEALASTRKRGFKFGRKSSDPGFLDEYQGQGRLTRCQALLNQDIIASAYKVDGRKIPKHDALRILGQDICSLQSVLGFIEVTINNLDVKPFGNQRRELKMAMEGFRKAIATVDQRKKALYNEKDISDEPITKVLYPGGVDAKAPLIWNDYSAWFGTPPEEPPFLHMEAKKSRVQEFTWTSSNIIAVFLENDDTKYFATPLKPVEEGLQADEIKIGDIAILAGQYMIIAEPREDSGNIPIEYFLMTNSLKVTSVEDVNGTRRGANRRPVEISMEVALFR
ncbi:MAG: hypothetical protein MMC33_008330 [Icmadophila ericetorum]|nr:hypothetical protein [Icmadophila ericetorum]